jgi:Leucine-rich repeat (LRR) protein
MHGWRMGPSYVHALTQATPHTLSATQIDADMMTQDQLASVCQRTSSWLRELRAAGIYEDSVGLVDLTPLTFLSRFTALDLCCHLGIKDLTPLSTLTGLRELRLGGCFIQSLDPLRGLTALTFLDLSHNDEITDLEPLASLMLLAELNVSACNLLESLEPLAALSQLRKLELADLPIPDIEPLSALVFLEDLDLNNMENLSSLEFLRPEKLWKLNLSYNWALISLEPLGSATRLLDLNLENCHHLPSLALAPLSHCTALKQLDIRSCQTFDLAPLASCRDLRRIYTCPRTGQPPLDLTPLQDLMPRLRIKETYERFEWDDARHLSDSSSPSSS